MEHFEFLSLVTLLRDLSVLEDCLRLLEPAEVLIGVSSGFNSFSTSIRASRKLFITFSPDRAEASAKPHFHWAANDWPSSVEICLGENGGPTDVNGSADHWVVCSLS